jgi:hypothetical protein
MYIFLDESGDLGFNLTKKKTSRFFVITLLVSKNLHSVREINISIIKTLKKINNKKRVEQICEIKGINTPISMKKYFLERISGYDWCIYSIIVDKKNFLVPKYINQSTYLYNYIASTLFKKLIVEKSDKTIIINVDKCKPLKETYEFNRRIGEVFYPKLCATSNLIINHHNSHDMKLLQAVDLFCYGVFSKYEHQDLSWYSCFQDRIYFENVL